jgi:ATP-dependent Clp protease ATP-binding subunit ClpC
LAVFSRCIMCYEQFTDDARKVMQVANQEAQRFNQPYIGTEHVLLGLAKERVGVAANVLMQLGIDYGAIAAEVQKLVQGAEPNVIGKLPLTPTVTRALQYAMDECLALEHNYIGTEHLLLGLLRETESVAVQVLMNQGLKLETVRQKVFDILGHGTASGDATE